MAFKYLTELHDEKYLPVFSYIYNFDMGGISLAEIRSISINLISIVSVWIYTQDRFWKETCEKYLLLAPMVLSVRT